MKIALPVILLVSACACNWTPPGSEKVTSLKERRDSLLKDTLPIKSDSIPKDHTINKEPAISLQAEAINTGNTTPGKLISFAKTLIGVPYVYASADPATGFDCSGFITYVFSHFNIKVPRSSIDFTRVGRTISVEEAKQGDIILFTGTDEFDKDIGHMGLVVANNRGALNFIHATSGKAMAVTVSPLDAHYKKRFVRVSRIFKQNS